MAKPGTSKAIRERAEKQKAKTETQRVKDLEKTDAVFRGTLSQRALEVAKKTARGKGRELHVYDLQKEMRYQAKKKK